MDEKFAVVTTRMGATSIRDNGTGEIMHNPVGPWVEANSLYIEQSRLGEKLRESTDGELIVFDVGLGAAASALAALHCARKIKSRRRLRIISFERDLDLLRFALKSAPSFPHFSGFEASVDSILQRGGWIEDGLVWELRQGDYVRLIEQEVNSADIIFYDPYSAKRNSDMWNMSVFKKTLQKCSLKGGQLFTYSRATPVRVALLVAGFFVGVGSAIGPKDETTQCATRLSDLINPLGQEWLGRWRRSRFPNALGASQDDFLSIQERVVKHPQFADFGP